MIPNPEDHQFMASRFDALEALARRLRHRAGLHPQDPDALDDHERLALKRLEQDMEDL